MMADDISFEIQNVLKINKFNDYKLIKSNKTIGNYIFKCVTSDNKNVVIKIISKKYDLILSSYQREHFNSDLLNKYNSEVDEKQKIEFTNVITSAEDNNYYWIIREYIDGESLSEDMQNYDNLNLKYFSSKLNHSYFDQIVQKLALIHQIKLRLLNKDLLEFISKNPKKILDQPLEYIKSRKEKPQINLAQHENYLNKFINNYSDEKNQVVVMGDLNPANIIISPQHKVIISDISNMSYDNCMFDFAYFWLFLWQSREWQNKLVEKYVKNQEDKEFFILTVIRTLLPIAWHKNEDIPAHIVERQKIWIKYLAASGESFEALMKVKAED